MFSFHFVYADGSEYTIGDITKVIIHSSAGYSELSGDDILSAKIPLPFKSMNLYGSSVNITVSGNDIKVIHVLKKG